MKTQRPFHAHFTRSLPVISLAIGLAIASLATSAYGLNIVATYDSSITSDPNAGPMTNAINAAIHVLNTNIVDNVTVNVTFVSDESVGLGESDTFGIDVPYSSFLTALRSHSVSLNDVLGLSKLPVSTTDPLIGGTQIHLTTAQARLLGLFSSGGLDSTVSFKMSLMNFTRPGSNPDKYDLQETANHELNEVLGISSGLPDTSEVWPADLFRYTTNLVRTFTTSGDNAYFSVDGTNLLARYNTDPTGDYGDWWSQNDVFWAPPGNPRHAQVQDAFGEPGGFDNLGTNELAILDVVGWTLAVAPPSAVPKLKIVHSSLNQFTLTWTNTATGYVLQESTNLLANNWAFSFTGGTNPAVLLSTNSPKFYRLYKPSGSSQSPPASAVVPSSAPPATPYVVTRRLNPRNP